MCGHISVGCIEVDQQCRGSNGKAKIEGYMSVSDGEAHHQFMGMQSKQFLFKGLDTLFWGELENAYYQVG